VTINMQQMYHVLPRAIPPEELAARLARAPAPVVVDLRKPDDYRADPRIVPGAAKRDLARLPLWAPELPQDRFVVVYCQKGLSVANAAVDALRARGFTAVMIEGGFAAWQAAGLPLVDPPEPVR
jgi:rhodanese-related sulfurtransferase